MKKVIVIAVAILLVLSGVTVAALYYIGDKMVDSLIDSELSSLLEEQPTSSSDASSTSSASSAAPEATPSPEPSGTTSLDTDSQNKATGTETSTSNSAVETTKSAENAEAPVKNPTDQKSTTPEPGKQKPKDKIQYTVEKMNEIKEKVTATDKINSAALLVKRLSSADMEELKRMLPGGVDAAEKKRAKEIMYQRFSAKEIETIREMYAKYMDE